MLSVSEALSYFDDAVGIGRKGTIDKPYILKAPFWTVDTLFYAVPKEKMALDFVYCLFQIIDWKSKDESTGVPSLSKVAINSVDISIPKSEEQVRIGAIFLKIDNLITLHQRKEKMRFLQMFCKFKRVKKAFVWEQRKFGDVFDYERPDRYIVVNDKYNDNFKTPVLTANKGFILGYTNEDRTYDKPCIIFDDFTLDCKFVDFTFMVKSSALKILTVKIGNILRFAYERLNSSKIENLGHARHYISVVQPTETTMPTCDEQECIAILFEQLDNLITLHQCKGNKYGYNKMIPLNFYQSIKMANAWEQRKFSELYRKVSEKNDLTYGKKDIISVANMHFKEESYITDSEYLRTYNVFLLGDIAFEGNKSKDFKHGRFVENTIGNGIVSHVFDVFRPIMDKYDLLFWKYAINNERLMGQILVRSTKASTMMTNLVAADFLNEYFLVPEDGEQKAIGKTLNAIDNLITLHQCKQYGKLGGVVDRFFSYSKVQKTNTWEQRKLGEISEKTIEKNRERKYSETFTNSAEFGIVSQMEYFDHAISKIESIGGYYVVHPNDFVYNPRISVSAPVGPINRNKLQKIGVMSPLYTVFRAHTIHPQYLEFYFKSDVWHAYMRFNGDSGARSDRFSIKTVLFFDMPIPCPQLEEQEKIGKLLEIVDNLITLHQRGENT